MSITAFLAERDALDRAWQQRCKAKGWLTLGDGGAERIKEELDYLRRRSCRSGPEATDERLAVSDMLLDKHFPRLNLGDPEVVDSPSRLWAYVVFNLAELELADAALTGMANGDFVRQQTYNDLLQGVYAAMHRIGITWTPTPDYRVLRAPEARDMLLHIRNRLEAEEGPSASPPAEKRSGQRTRNAIAVPHLLESWDEIFEVIGKPLTKDRQKHINRLRKANKRYAGPIMLGSQGEQPKAERGELLDWWERMCQDLHERETERANRSRTVENQYPHGRDAVIVPDIDGHVRKRKRAAPREA